MNEQKHKRHAAREAFQESLERLQQVLDLAEDTVAQPELNERFQPSPPKVPQPEVRGEVAIDLWEDAVNDIDRFLESD